MVFKIGSTLKKIRTSKGITQQKVADYAGISQSNYSKYEKDKIDVNSEALIHILDFMDIPFQEFSFILNKHELLEKEDILQRFFNIPLQDIEALKEIKRLCNQHLTHSHSILIQHTSILCDALIFIYKDNDFTTAKKLAKPIWDELSNNNEFFLYDLYFVNAILYIFASDEVINIKNFILRAYEKYNKYPNIISIFVNLHVNISLLLIENQLWEDALETLNLIEEICKSKKLYFQLAIIYIRKGICQNNIEQNSINGGFLINKGIEYLKLFSELDVLKVLELEITEYNIDPKI